MTYWIDIVRNCAENRMSELSSSALEDVLMKVALLGTSIAAAHAAAYKAHPDVEVVIYGHTPGKAEELAAQFGYTATTDLDSVFEDPAVDLVDICLPTRMHTDLVLRALAAGKHALSEYPLAPDLAEAHKVAEAAAASDKQVFVNMFNRFLPANRVLFDAADTGRYGRLLHLSLDMATALLWPGASIGLQQIPLDSMGADIDTIMRILGQPTGFQIATTAKSAAAASVDALLEFPDAAARTGTDSMLPMSWGARGGYRAVFENGVLNNAFTMGFDGKADGTVTAYTDESATELELPADDQYTAMVAHVLDCVNGKAANMIGPDTVLDSLEVTLRIDRAVNG